jgi:hypothetical protein
VADPVGQDDEVLRCVERLPRTEERAGERVAEELGAAACRAVQHQDRGKARCSQRAVVQPQRRHRLARGETEVLHHEVSLAHGQRSQQDGDHAAQLATAC